jgi:hypothetical protein
MQKHYRVWYRVAVVCWLLIIGTINILNLAMLHAFTFEAIEKDGVILLVGIFSLYCINYYFDNL